MKRFIPAFLAFLMFLGATFAQQFGFYGYVYTTDDAGNTVPLEGASVYVYFKAEYDSLFIFMDSAQTDVNGYFAIDMPFEQGMYEIQFWANSCDDFFPWGPVDIQEPGLYEVDPVYLCYQENTGDDDTVNYDLPYFSWYYDTADYHTIWFYPEFYDPTLYTNVFVDFGDGTYDFLQYNSQYEYWEPISHTYQYDDIYPAAFIGFTQDNDTLGFLQEVYVYSYEPEYGDCYADFGYTYDSLDYHTVYFYNFSYPNDEYVSFYWDFGDGEYSMETDPIHTYMEPGEYWVFMYMEDSLTGCFDYVELPVWIDDPDSLWFDDYQDECQALFFAEYYADTAIDSENGYMVFFYDLSWPGMNSEITHMLWTFGDGDTSTVPFPIHIYQDLGTYPVTLEIQTDNGCSSVFSMLITLDTVVVDTNYILFFPDFVEEVKGMKVKFHNLSEGGDENLWVWDFGDSKKTVTTKGADVVYHTYEQAGNYTVKLTNKNDGSWFAMDIRVNNDGLTVLRSYSSFASGETPTGAERNIEISNSILVYPNPAVDYVNVSAADAQDISVKVFSADGKIVKQVQGEGSELKVDVSDLNNGVYIFEVNAGENKAQFKIIK